MSESVPTQDDRAAQARLEAVHQVACVAEFDRGGTLRTANLNFAEVFGASPAELRGRAFADLVERSDSGASADELLARVRSGARIDDSFQLRTAAENSVWMRGGIGAIVGDDGGFALIGLDVTERLARAHESQHQLESIGRSQAVIEFEPDGTILAANQNFQEALGYRSEEIVGQHHRLFVKPDEVDSAAYRSFWSKLAAGESFVGEFERVRKDGSSIWILASYNPIQGERGRIVKVVKFAVDVTEMAMSRASMSTAAERVATTAQQLQGLSSTMAGSARSTGNEAVQVGDAIMRVGSNSRSLASSTEEMSASIAEIARNAQAAANVAREAVESAGETNASIRQLGVSSGEIGEVVKVITSIAEQTNLLALNATIEAARAGDAGKGFAVVANEVKELAKATAAATDDISRRVAAIQTDTESAIAAIASISDTVARINDTQSTIAGAVEEQTATTKEMARSVADVARDSSAVEEAVERLVESAQETGQAAEQASGAADDLASLSRDLRSTIERA